MEEATTQAVSAGEEASERVQQVADTGAKDVVEGGQATATTASDTVKGWAKKAGPVGESGGNSAAEGNATADPKSFIDALLNSPAGSESSEYVDTASDMVRRRACPLHISRS